MQFEVKGVAMCALVGRDGGIGSKWPQGVESDLDLWKKFIPRGKWEEWIGAAKCRNHMVLCRSPAAFRSIRAMVIWWDKLDLVNGAGEVGIEFVRGLIIDAHDIDFVTEGCIEIDGGSIGAHIL